MEQNEIYKNLEVLLEDEIKVYRVLLEHVRREKDLLIAANLDELNENNKSKEQLILKLRGLERLREKAAREMAIICGASKENPRLLEIALRLRDPESSKLRGIHSTLELLISRIREINESNGSLVEGSLRVINGTLGAIKDTLQTKPVYGQSGDMKKTEPVAGHFVSKEV